MTTCQVTFEITGSLLAGTQIMLSPFGMTAVGENLIEECSKALLSVFLSHKRTYWFKYQNDKPLCNTLRHFTYEFENDSREMNFTSFSKQKFHSVLEILMLTEMVMIGLKPSLFSIFLFHGNKHLYSEP